MSRFHRKMQIYAMVDNKPVLCDFDGASRSNLAIKGTFSTNNPKLIEAIEKHGGFDKTFFLHSTSEDQQKVDDLQFRSTEINPPEEVEEEEKEVEKVEKVEEKQPEPVKQEVKEPEQEISQEEHAALTVVSKQEVITVQEAKEYLKSKFPELTARMLLNKSMILQAAKAKGIRFEALN